MFNYQEMLKSVDYSKPFPFAVFGTLKKGYCNHHLMNPNKILHSAKGFIPGYYASNLWLIAKPLATCPVEIYYYHPDNWNEIIDNIDLLESFVYNKKNPKYYYHAGYERTLAEVRILPNDYKLPGLNIKVRDLGIDEKDWDKYETVPCWIYSNNTANKAKPVSVLWTGESC